MKSLRQLMLTAVFLIAGSPAWASIELSKSVEYLQGAATRIADCAWEDSMVTAALAKSNGTISVAGEGAPVSAVKLSLQIVKFTRPREGKVGDYLLVVRSNLLREGKLLATRDLQDDGSFRSAQAACDTLRAAGVSLGRGIAKWATETQLMACNADCAGIHPDQTIVIGTQVLPDVDAVNDTVRDECKWPTAMLARLVREFNESEPAPRAKLEQRAIDVKDYPGRRLVLRVQNLHALGGGGWTGPKWLDMSGELWDGDDLVGKFTLHSTSGRGLTTCSSVDSLSEDAADRIADWLRGPSMESVLD